MENSKYLDPLKKQASAHYDIVQDELVAFHMAKMIAKTGFQGGCKISEQQWKSLGEPPAKQMGDSYIINLGNPEIVGRLWMKSCFDAINLGCYAATDITDSVGKVNDDNLDKILTDREAMVAISQIAIAGMNAFREMKKETEEAMSK